MLLWTSSGTARLAALVIEPFVSLQMAFWYPENFGARGTAARTKAAHRAVRVRCSVTLQVFDTLPHVAMLTSANSAAMGVRILSLALGVFFLFMGLDKLAWFGDPGLLNRQLHDWSRNAPAPSRWYLHTIAIPGAPIFALLVPLGELAVGAGLLLGVQVRLAALAGLFMVLNFHFGMGVLLRYSYLWNGYGPPVLGGLVALAVGGPACPSASGRARHVGEQPVAVRKAGSNSQNRTGCSRCSSSLSSSRTVRPLCGRSALADRDGSGCSALARSGRASWWRCCCPSWTPVPSASRVVVYALALLLPSILSATGCLALANVLTHARVIHVAASLAGAIVGLLAGILVVVYGLGVW